MFLGLRSHACAGVVEHAHMRCLAELQFKVHTSQRKSITKAKVTLSGGLDRIRRTPISLRLIRYHALQLSNYSRTSFPSVMSMYSLQAYQGLAGRVFKCPCVRTITCTSDTPAHKPGSWGKTLAVGSTIIETHTEKTKSGFSVGSDPHRRRPRRQKRRPSWSSLALRTKRRRKVRKVQKVAHQGRAVTRSSTLALTTWARATVRMRAVRLKRKRPGKQLQHWPLSAPVWTALIPVTLRTARPAATQVGFSVFNIYTLCPWLHPSRLSYIAALCAVCNLIFPTDAFDFCEESSPGATEGQKGRTGKSSDKSKDSGTGLKKIFSGPKKVSEGFFISW